MKEEAQEFTQVLSEKELEEFMIALSREAAEILCLLPDGKYAKLKSTGTNSEYIKAKLLLDAPTAQTNSKVHLSVLVGKTKYLLKTILEIDSPQLWFFRVTPTVFKVQRRDSFRVKTPGKAKFEIEMGLLKDSEKFAGRVIDVSLNGALVGLKNVKDKITLKSEVSGAIIFQEEKKIEIQARVIRIHPKSAEEEDHPNETVMALQFTHISPGDSSRLNEVILKCARLNKKYGES